MFKCERSGFSEETTQARKIHEKSESLGLKVSKILAKESEQAAQSENFVDEMTKDLRTNIEADGLLKKAEKFLGESLSPKTKDDIVAATPSLELMMKAEKYAKAIIESVHSDPALLNENQKKFFKLFFRAYHYNGKSEEWLKLFRLHTRRDQQKFITALDGVKQKLQTIVDQLDASDPSGVTYTPLNAFAEKFPETAELIQNSPPAMEHVQNAAKAGVVFGGYSEEASEHFRGDRAFTAGKNVYIPKALTDKMVAMANFLLELNNGMNSSRFAGLSGQAQESKIGADDFVLEVVKLEMEAEVRTSEIVLKMKEASENPAEFDHYYINFFINRHKDQEDHDMTIDDMARHTMQRVYDTGPYKDNTIKEYLITEYNRLVASAAGTSFP